MFLSDLITLRQVLVEVMFAVKLDLSGKGAMES
jgi:hypothetical protein